MFDYNNDPFAEGARKYQQELINKATRRLKHNLIQRTNERNYYKNKSEQLNEQVRELKKQIAILQAHNDLLLLKIKELE